MVVFVGAARDLASSPLVSKIRVLRESNSPHYSIFHTFRRVGHGVLE